MSKFLSPISKPPPQLAVHDQNMRLMFGRRILKIILNSDAVYTDIRGRASYSIHTYIHTYFICLGRSVVATLKADVDLP